MNLNFPLNNSVKTPQFTLHHSTVPNYHLGAPTPTGSGHSQHVELAVQTFVGLVIQTSVWHIIRTPIRPRHSYFCSDRLIRLSFNSIIETSIQPSRLDLHSACSNHCSARSFRPSFIPFKPSFGPLFQTFIHPDRTSIHPNCSNLHSARSDLRLVSHLDLHSNLRSVDRLDLHSNLHLDGHSDAHSALCSNCHSSRSDLCSPCCSDFFLSSMLWSRVASTSPYFFHPTLSSSTIT